MHEFLHKLHQGKLHFDDFGPAWYIGAIWMGILGYFVYSYWKR